MEKQDLQRVVEVIQEMINSIRRVSISQLEMTRNIAEVLSAIKFPNLDSLDLDYEELRAITDESAAHGWTLAPDLDLERYWNTDLIGMTLVERDKHFHNVFREVDGAFYKESKEDILRNADKRWEPLLDQCFNNMESGCYAVAIPCLFNIIEGELADYTGPAGGAWQLAELVKKKHQDEKDIAKITAYSLAKGMQLQLFAKFVSNKDRESVINRNRVLHGRDDPRLWTG